MLKKHILNRLMLFFFFLCIFVAQVNAYQTNIQIWDFPRWLPPEGGTNRFYWLESKIKEFQELHPNIKVNLTKLTWERGHEKLKIAAIGGSNPDISAGTIPLLFIKEKMIEPINDYIDAQSLSDYFKAALDAFTIDENIYAWPWYMSGQLLFVNKDIFDNAQVELPVEGRWTPEEFEEKLMLIKNYFDCNCPENSTQSFTKSAYYPLGLYFQRDETANLPFLLSYGGDFTDNKQFIGDSKETISGIEWTKKLIKQKLAPPDSGGRNSTDIWTGFARQQRFAVAAFGLWGINGLRKINPPMNFEVVHFPAFADSASYIGTSGYYVFKNPDKERLKAAMLFASFLTNSQNQNALYQYTQFPTRRSTGNIYKDDKEMSMASKVFAQGRSVLQDSRWPQIDEQLQTTLQEILLDRIEIKTGILSLKNKINKILKTETGSMKDEINKSKNSMFFLIIIFLLAIVITIKAKQTHLLMIIPALIILILFLFLPLIDALVLAFKEFRIGDVGSISLENLKKSIFDEQFRQACINTLIYSIIVVPANVFSALVFASLVSNLSGKLKSFFRAAYYLPGVASVVVLTMVWRWIFNMEVGLFNSVLSGLGAQPIGWLTNPDVALWSIIISGILKSPGGAMLIYMASISNIPVSLYESAELEGASELQKWWHITVPLLKSTTAFLIITGTIASLQVFAQVLMLTDGGPGFSTTVVVHRIYTSAFRDFDFGLSSAMALILFFAIMIITIFQRKYIEQETEYLA